MKSCEEFVGEVLLHCIFAIGRGADMNIQRESLVKWWQVVYPYTSNFICLKESPAGDHSAPGEERWETVRERILEICEAVGRLGARTAIDRGGIVITPDDLKHAFNTVREATCLRAERKEGYLCDKWS
jgi:hypothetical protein